MSTIDVRGHLSYLPMCWMSIFWGWMGPDSVSLDISAPSMASVVWFIIWLSFSWTWKLQRYLVIKTNQELVSIQIWAGTIRCRIDKMQDQEEAFWRIELVTHCICCSRGSCKSNRTALLQLSIETPFKQNKQNHSLHILWAAQRFCEITPVYKSHSGDFHTIVRQWTRSMLHTCRCSRPQPS